MNEQDILLQEIKPSYADKKATQTIGTCILAKQKIIQLKIFPKELIF